MALPPVGSLLGIAGAALCWRGMVSASLGQDADPLKFPDTQLEPLGWTALDGWAADDHVASFSAFLKSCTPFLNSKEPRGGRPIHTALWQVCRRAARLGPTTAAEAQAFFEENFRPVSIARIGEAKGLLTGYYEPVVDGSRFPNPEFYAPLYRRPRDLLIGGRAIRKADVPNPATLNPRKAPDQMVPHYHRCAIWDDALA